MQDDMPQQTWLAGYGSNTRRSYARAVAEFFAFAGRPAAEIRAQDVAAWKAHLQVGQLATATIQQRLAAVSSFFRYLVTTPGPDGAPMLQANPAAGVGRRDLTTSPYGRSRKITAAQFQKVLQQVDPSTIKGARDRALLLFYVLCARRRREVVSLRGRDLRLDGQKVAYRVRLKGGAERWKELPQLVWGAISQYLQLAGRVLSDEEPLFVAVRGHATGNQPLSGQAVEDALRRYAARAGLEPSEVTLHSLRHLGAELFQEAAGDVRQTQMFLDHAQLATTQIYLERLAGDEHRHWQAMARQLGIK